MYNSFAARNSDAAKMVIDRSKINKRKEKR